MTRKKGGRLAKLTRADRVKKQKHDERTNRKGKIWAAKHVVKDPIKFERERKQRELKEKAEREHDKLRERLEAIGVPLPPKSSS